MEPFKISIPYKSRQKINLGDIFYAAVKTEQQTILTSDSTKSAVVHHWTVRIFKVIGIHSELVSLANDKNTHVQITKFILQQNGISIPIEVMDENLIEYIPLPAKSNIEEHLEKHMLFIKDYGNALDIANRLNQMEINRAKARIEEIDISSSLKPWKEKNNKEYKL